MAKPKEVESPRWGKISGLIPEFISGPILKALGRDDANETEVIEIARELKKLHEFEEDIRIIIESIYVGSDHRARPVAQLKKDITDSVSTKLALLFAEEPKEAIMTDDDRVKTYLSDDYFQSKIDLIRQINRVLGGVTLRWKSSADGGIKQFSLQDIAQAIKKDLLYWNRSDFGNSPTGRAVVSHDESMQEFDRIMQHYFDVTIYKEVEPETQAFVVEPAPAQITSGKPEEERPRRRGRFGRRQVRRDQGEKPVISPELQALIDQVNDPANRGKKLNY